DMVAINVNAVALAFAINVPTLSKLEQGQGLDSTTSMGTFSFTDKADPTDVFTFTLSGADAGLFTLNPTTGELFTGASPIAGSPGGTTYHIIITATDVDEPAVQFTTPVAIVVGNPSSSPGDNLVLGAGVNMAYGLNGPDIITGNSGFDAISGGQQNDTIT